MKLMARQGGPAPSAAPTDWQARLAKKWKPGTPAPDFTLPATRGQEVTLAHFRGRPVVLFFGSFSCDEFCERVGAMERLYQAYQDRARFLFVSVTEAGHQIPGLEFMLDQPNPAASSPLEERRGRIAKAMKQMSLTMPGAVDVKEEVETAYDAYPMRLVLVAADGTIALDMGRGLFEPWDFDAVRAWLKSQPQQPGEP
jgi:peroxiredoxin